MPIESLSGQSHEIYLIDGSEELRVNVQALIHGSSTFRLSLVTDVMDLLSHPDRHPDTIILDFVSQEQPLEMIDNLSKRLPDTSILGICGAQDPPGIEQLERMGLLACMEKPLSARDFRRALRSAERIQDLRRQLRHMQDSIGSEVRLEQIIARSGTMHNVMALIRKACTNDINVLLEGEEGTGKKLLARAIHFNGLRAAAPFVMLNCAAIPQHLLERELYGSEAGVFGEDSELTPGIFEQAEGGTLLIDEIGEMDIQLQARLYRTMQTRMFRRIGSEEDLPINVRIITATSRDLRAMCSYGTFREDLFFRLASFPIKLPPLRDRPADIPLLIDMILRRVSEKEGRPGLGISSETVQLLRKYRWPGNIPELMLCMERAAVVAESMEVQPDDLPDQILIATGRKVKNETNDSGGAKASPLPTMDQLKARGIRLALEASHGNVKEAARMLDIGRTTIYKLIEKYNIQV